VRVNSSSSECPGSEENIPGEKKAAVILAIIALAESSWVFVNAYPDPSRFLRYTGFLSGHAGIPGWALGVLVAFVFVLVGSRFPSVRGNLVNLSGLKILALLVAISSGLCEESVFRKFLMDSLQHAGYGTVVQVLAAGLLFGLAHGVWGIFRGSLSVGIGATIATGTLGAALALVYVASHRVLAPAVVSHFLINVFAEPGLVLAAVRGEMGR
jgi:membrane protease YdiL (CAAX protease family)